VLDPLDADFPRVLDGLFKVVGKVRGDVLRHCLLSGFFYRLELDRAIIQAMKIFHVVVRLGRVAVPDNRNLLCHYSSV
jgi:hypothetical protein